jgi:hypothetical protein
VTFTARWGLVWAAWDYPSWGDLPEIAGLLRRGSPFQRALAGEFTNVINVNNPTDSQMRDSLLDATILLSQQVPEGGVGELVVNFQGHGGGGRVYGVDEGPGLGPTEMMRRAQMARELGVHIVYVLDTCNVGQAVMFAQAEMSQELRRQAGTLPGDQQRELTERLDVARTLGTHLAALNRNLSDLYSLRRAAARPDGVEATRPFFDAIRGVLTELRDYAEGSPAGAADLGPITELSFEPFTTALVASVDPSRRAIFTLRRQIEPLLDRINDITAAILTDVRSRLAGAGSAGTSAGGGRAGGEAAAQ